MKKKRINQISVLVLFLLSTSFLLIGEIEKTPIIIFKLDFEGEILKEYQFDQSGEIIALKRNKIMAIYGYGSERIEYQYDLDKRIIASKTIKKDSNDNIKIQIYTKYHYDKFDQLIKTTSKTIGEEGLILIGEVSFIRKDGRLERKISSVESDFLEDYMIETIHKYNELGQLDKILINEPRVQREKQIKRIKNFVITSESELNNGKSRKVYENKKLYNDKGNLEEETSEIYSPKYKITRRFGYSKTGILNQIIEETNLITTNPFTKREETRKKVKTYEMKFKIDSIGEKLIEKVINRINKKLIEEEIQ